MYLTMRQILVLTELREQLAGKCGDTCPKLIATIMFDDKATANAIWGSTHWCEYGDAGVCKHFHFIQAIKPNLNCPCNRGCNPEEIFLHLDELIGEAK